MQRRKKNENNKSIDLRPKSTFLQYHYLPTITAFSSEINPNQDHLPNISRNQALSHRGAKSFVDKKDQLTLDDHIGDLDENLHTYREGNQLLTMNQKIVGLKESKLRKIIADKYNKIRNRNSRVFYKNILQKGRMRESNYSKQHGKQNIINVLTNEQPNSSRVHERGKNLSIDISMNVNKYNEHKTGTRNTPSIINSKLKDQFKTCRGRIGSRTSFNNYNKKEVIDERNKINISIPDNINENKTERKSGFNRYKRYTKNIIPKHIQTKEIKDITGHKFHRKLGNNIITPNKRKEQLLSINNWQEMKGENEKSDSIANVVHQMNLKLGLRKKPNLMERIKYSINNSPIQISPKMKQERVILEGSPKVENEGRKKINNTGDTEKDRNDILDENLRLNREFETPEIRLGWNSKNNLESEGQEEEEINQINKNREVGMKMGISLDKYKFSKMGRKGTNLSKLEDLSTSFDICEDSRHGTSYTRRRSHSHSPARTYNYMNKIFSSELFTEFANEKQSNKLHKLISKTYGLQKMQALLDEHMNSHNRKYKQTKLSVNEMLKRSPEAHSFQAYINMLPIILHKSKDSFIRDKFNLFWDGKDISTFENFLLRMQADLLRRATRRKRVENIKLKGAKEGKRAEGKKIREKEFSYLYERNIKNRRHRTMASLLIDEKLKQLEEDINMENVDKSI